MKNDCSLCQQKSSQIILRTAPFKRGCRYHRKQRQIFKERDLCPGNFCPHAYAKIYPHALSLLYNSGLKSEKILCPHKKFQVEFHLSSTYTLPSLIRKLKKFSLFCLNKVGVAGEFPDKKISIKVKRTDGRCPKDLSKGDIFTFNIWRREELCPASFYAMYPFYLKGFIPSFHCPDPNGVSYETPLGNLSCREILSKYETKNNSLCPLLIYSLFPYYLTLKTGGKLEWVIPGENVQVQCPDRQGVAMQVFLSNKNQRLLQIKIIKVGAVCYRKLKRGQNFFLSEKDFNQVNSCLWKQKQH